MDKLPIHPPETSDTLADVMAGCFLVVVIITIIGIVYISVTVMQWAW